MKGVNVSSEFIAEAQELIEGLGRDLIALEAASRTNAIDPDQINTLFRRAHTLKGISAMFELGSMAQLAHALEDFLDAMRLGRVMPNPESLDVLYGCVESFTAMLGVVAMGEDPEGLEIEPLVDRLHRAIAQPNAAEPLQVPGLGPEVLSVLTEYEEHRLRANLSQQRGLYLLHTSFELASFDLGLAEIEATVKGLGEVITKLPSARESEPGKICFDILVGADTSVAALQLRLNDDHVQVVCVQGSGVQAAATPAVRGGQAAEFVRPPSTPVATAVAAAGEPLDSGELTASLKSVSQTVRVDIRRLDRLMNLVGELSLTRAAFQRLTEAIKQTHGSGGIASELQNESRVFERRLAELQSGIMEVRMVPLASLFERMVRAGRKLARELGRQVRIEVRGEHTELDKLIVEDLADPLMHLMRNAIDHGIEPGPRRREQGKSEEGTLHLTAAAQGNHVVVEVADDGQGVDVARTLQIAVERGLVSADRAVDLPRRDIYNLLFLPGFSTRTEVSHYSGRGVGLDVVKTNISQLSGVIDVDSTPGQGTRFTMTLPITLAIIPALLVEVSSCLYAIPLNNVLETIELRAPDVQTIEHREVISLRGSTVPLLDLRQIFHAGDRPRPEMAFGVVAGIAQSRMALVVDELIGQQDIVIKSLGPRLQGVPGIAGATELGNQRTILVIDMMGLLAEMQSEQARP